MNSDAVVKYKELLRIVKKNGGDEAEAKRMLQSYDCLGKQEIASLIECVWVVCDLDDYVVPFGKKHKDKTLLQIYNADPSYVTYLYERSTEPEVAKKVKKFMKAHKDDEVKKPVKKRLRVLDLENSSDSE